jgi:hypothetical protein
MKGRLVGLVSIGAWVLALLVLASQAKPVRGQQPAIDDYDTLDAFLPGDGDPRDEDAKVLVMINCTACHGPADTRSRIANRAGGDAVFWRNVVERMSQALSANIPEEDRKQIAGYLAKYFGPRSARRTTVNGKKP